MKKCPYCSKAQKESLRCKYCGAILCDRRRHPRFEVYSEIRCKNFNGANTWIDGQLKNISLGGALFTAFDRLSGLIVISLPGIGSLEIKTIDLFAKVIEAKEYMDIGRRKYDIRVAFIRPKRTAKSLLQEFINLMK